MKSLEELNALRNQMKNKIGIRHDEKNTIKIVIGMGTMGIENGAREVVKAFADEVFAKELNNVAITQTACVNIPDCEPVVEVIFPEAPKVTYVKVTPQIAKEIVAEHIINNKPLSQYTIENNAK